MIRTNSSFTMRSISLCLLGLSAAFADIATFNLASAQEAIAHRVVQVSPRDVRSAVEVSIAINPKNPDNLVAACIMRGYSKSTKPNFTFQSIDGGKTWKTQPSLNPDDRMQGDDVVLFSADGVAVHAYICFTGLYGDRPDRSSNGIFISRSVDQGDSWQKPVLVVDHLNSRSPMEDKPWLVFDRSPHSTRQGALYCSWTRFDVYGSQDPQDSSQIMFARSTNGGESFEPVTRISDLGGDCVDGDGTVEGATPCVGADGTVYVVWAGPRGIEIDQSNDGGKTFGKDRVIADMPGGWNHDVEGIGRANGMPVTAADLSGGPHGGTLYVNWIDERNGDKDVFLISSRDAGQTWSEPLRVNDDPLENGRDQFFTWMAVDPTDGAVNIAFYDRRDTQGAGTKLTLARSIDGGATFKNYAIDRQPEFKCAPGSFFGDYIGIDAFSGRVAIAYMHNLAAKELAVSAAIFEFKPGTLDVIEN